MFFFFFFFYFSMSTMNVWVVFFVLELLDESNDLILIKPSLKP